MNIVTDTNALAELCQSLAKADYVTIDTEFIREKTYYPQLCLIQVANDDLEAIIAPLADGIDLKPLFTLLQDDSIIKVIHGGRQDVEIFYYLSGEIPHPLFDTQIAGMVCGFGDQVGYEAMINKILNIQIDKGSRFTDWSHRPLSDKQLAYAMADVTHLRLAYKYITERIENLNRSKWVMEEMKILTSPSTYQNPPDQAWERIKINTRKRRALAILKETAAWREETAQRDDEPRGRILRDNALTEIALHPPKTTQELRKMRSIHPSFFDGKRPDELLEAVKRGQEIPDKNCPKKDKPTPLPSNIGPVVEMLRVLLRIKCEEHNVAPKLLANTRDLEQIAANDKADIPALKGWRYDVFGKSALAVKQGKIGFVIENNEIHIRDLDAGLA
jgi:ribonuclease D